MLAGKKRSIPKPRSAPFPVPKKPRVASKGSMYRDELETTGGVSGAFGRSAKSGVRSGVVKAKPRPRSGVSGATYSPGKGTRVTPNARPKGKR